MTREIRWTRRALAAALAAGLAACGGGDTPSPARKAALAAGAPSEELSVVIANQPDPLLQGLTIPCGRPRRPGR
jgi:hypothetical protein